MTPTTFVCYALLTAFAVGVLFTHAIYARLEK